MLNVFWFGALQVLGANVSKLNVTPFGPRKNSNGTLQRWRDLEDDDTSWVQNCSQHIWYVFLEGVDVYVIGHSNVPLFRKKKTCNQGLKSASNKVCCQCQGRNISLSKTHCFWSNLILLTMTLLQSAASAILDAWQ